jgi:hypothetical protein
MTEIMAPKIFDGIVYYSAWDYPADMVNKADVRTHDLATGVNEWVFESPWDQVQVTTAGGSAPQWRGDGRELFFSTGSGIAAVDVRAGATFAVGAPKSLVTIEFTGGEYPGYRWSPTRDGQRFLVNTPSGTTAAGRFVVVTNWPAEIGRR